MKKIDNKGFVLAETLVVTVFLMVLFAMIYSNFLPLVGEFEKRETYDDIDSKYAIYWLKSMAESAVYDITGDANREKNMNEYGFVRFNCNDLTETDSQAVCKNLMKTLQVNGCDRQANNCDIYITSYRIGNTDDTTSPWFKNTVHNRIKRYRENCFSPKTNAQCKQSFIAQCESDNLVNHTNTDCAKKSEKSIFSDGFSDYIVSLPDYITPSANNAQYRIFAVFHNKRDNNNYYSYSTIEVNRN